MSTKILQSVSILKTGLKVQPLHLDFVGACIWGGDIFQVSAQAMPLIRGKYLLIESDDGLAVEIDDPEPYLLNC